jgi:hypothetical protein
MLELKKEKAMARKKNPDDDERQERYVRLEQDNLEPLPIIEKIKELEKNDGVTCQRDKCRCKCRKAANDSNTTYRED